MPPIISKSAKNAVFGPKIGRFWAKNWPFLGQKWAVFGPKMSREDPKLVLSLSTLKVDEVRQVSSILDNKKYRNASNYLKISQKRSF